MGLDEALINVIIKYQDSFNAKVQKKEITKPDILMEIFDITQNIKEENMQYWGRELGKCWEKLIQVVLNSNCLDYKVGLKIGDDELCDCIVKDFAIDAKYRVGSGDSGTLKKFKTYGKILHDQKMKPIMLFLREDNLQAAITAGKSGGWTIYTGDRSFEFIEKLSGFDLKHWLIEHKNKFILNKNRH